MKLRTITRRAWSGARARRHADSRTAKSARSARPEAPVRYYSLLLPPGDPADRR